MDRLNTKDMLQKRHWNVADGVECALCHTKAGEYDNHLVFDSILVEEFGLICRLPGLMGMIYMLLLGKPGGICKSFFVEVVLLLSRIFGLLEMQKSLGMRGPLF